MIEIELDICSEMQTCFYTMSSGEVQELRIQTKDGDTLDASELLEIDNVYVAIQDHYENFMKEANCGN